MKRIMTLAFVAALLCVPVAQADEKRIKTLENIAVGSNYVLLCENAVNADALQGTWQAVDTLAVSLGKPPVFGPQTTTVNDANACGVLRITRSHAVPPTVSVFSSLATLLIG